MRETASGQRLIAIWVVRGIDVVESISAVPADADGLAKQRVAMKS